MAEISRIALPDGNTYDLKDRRLSGVFVVKGTQTATTASWTGNLDIDALYDGLTIAYYLPCTSASNASLNLTLKDGTQTGAVPVYINGTTRASTHHGAGATILLTYWSAGSISINGTATTEARWTEADYWNSNTIGEYAGSCTAGPNGMVRYSLIMQVSENQWESLVLTSSTATSKSRNTNGFLLSSPILYQGAGTYASGANAANSACWSTAYNIDSRYSFNVNNKWSAAGRPLFLVGTISGNKFYLKETKWWADALPSTADGYHYWYVGQMSSAYQISLHPTHPIYYYDDGIKLYIPGMVAGAATVNGHTVNTDVPANAVFTDTDTTYTFAEGSSNGAFQVTPSGGSAQSVPIHGLGSLAYKSALTWGDIAGIPAQSS